jgi:hypothetical protein
MDLKYPTGTGLPGETEEVLFFDVAANVMNFIVMIFGGLSVLAFIISGIIYLTSYGNQDRIDMAKKSMLYSGIGIIVGLGALAVINLIVGLIGGEDMTK